MLTDATGAALGVGDRVGTITRDQNPLVLVGTVVRVLEVLVVVEVVSARRTGAPVSAYARLMPEVGKELRLNAYRVFKLPPVEKERRVFQWEELRVETRQPGIIVRITHLPSGSEVEVNGFRSLLEAKSEALEMLGDAVAAWEARNK